MGQPRKTHEQFIEEVIYIFKDRYILDKTKYVLRDEPIDKDVLKDKITLFFKPASKG